MGRLLLVITCIIIIYGCGGDGKTAVDNYELSGNIQFLQADGSPYDSLVVAQLTLYDVNNSAARMVIGNENHPFVGPQFDPALYQDHRLLELTYQSAGDDNGQFTMTDLEAGKYLLVYQAENFGWHRRIVDIDDDLYLNLIMRRSISDTEVIMEDTVWGPDAHVVVENDLAVLVGKTLTIKENSVIEMDDSSIILVGNMVLEGSLEEPVLITSSQQTPAKGDWNMVEITTSSTSSSFAYAILQWGNLLVNNKQQLDVTNTAFLNALSKGLSLDHSTGVYDRILLYDCGEGAFFSYTKEASVEPSFTYCIFSTINSSDNSYAMKCTESSPVVDNSIFYNNKYHLVLDYNSYPDYDHCLFTGSYIYGIWSDKENDWQGYMNFNYCDFQEDNIIFYLKRGAPVNVKESNLICTEGDVFSLHYYYGGNVVDASHNWWGTTVEEEIQELIWDENDQPGTPDAGTVIYTPWKNSTVGGTGPQLP